MTLAGLAACASGARNWTKPGVSDSQRAADFAQCRSQMRAVSKQNDDIDQDITATRGGDWRRIGQYNSQQSLLSQADSDYAAQVMRSCMKDRGYQAL